MTSDQRQKKSSISISEYINDSRIFKKTSDSHIECIICEKQIKFVAREGKAPLERHIKTVLHTRNAIIKEKHENNNEKSELWHHKFLNWLLMNKLPFNLLDQSSFTDFLEVNFGKSLYSSQHYKKAILPELYAEYKNSTMESVKKKPFYVMFDESPDRRGRKLLNILIGELNAELSTKPFILNTLELETVNSESIIRELNYALQKIFTNSSDSLNFRLLLTDKAAYCIKAGKMLKNIYNNMKHVTCLCHGLHNFAEVIRNRSPTLNKFATKFKKLLKHNSKNKKIYKKLTNMELPKFSVLTRWGSWLSTFKWIHDNIENIKSFLNDKIAEKLKKKYLKPEFNKEFNAIFEYLKQPGIITKLENSQLTVYQQFSLIEQARKLVDDDFKESFERIFNTNPDLCFFENYSSIKSSEKFFIYAPLTTCWAERSFSSMKLLQPEQRNMSVETLKQILAIYFNKFNV